MLREKMDEREKPDLKNLKRLKSEEIKERLCRAFSISPEKMDSYTRRNLYSKLFIWALYRNTNMTLKEIGRVYAKDYAAIGQLIRRFETNIRHADLIKKAKKVLDQKHELD